MRALTIVAVSSLLLLSCQPAPVPQETVRTGDYLGEPLPGAGNMPRVQYTFAGASERLAVSPGREENGYFHMPTGQSGHPLSPFYRHGHDDWVQGRPSPFLPREAQHKLILRPAP